MAGYSFTPKDNNIQRPKSNTSKKVASKKNNHTTATSDSDTLNKIKKPVFIAIALILAILLIGPQITGNLTLSAEDRAIAQNSDFPDLSKFDANKQFYLCQNQLNEDSGKLSQYQIELESKSTTAEACIQQKNTLSSQYTTCADELTSTKASFTYCNSSKTTLSNEVELYKNELESTKQEYSDFELNNYALENNYADDYCCIYRTVLGNTDLKYYTLEHNKVKCTEDEDDEEFDWENC
ncbi:MAG: hypothetical protein KAI18_00420 [Candidatus Aenigmarchaeota archaeon]|nr:hypothetical protein [Candidatus Aenigmarchaeota archaeon]